MESFFNMVDVQTVLFIYMAVGFFCRKVRIFTDEARDKLTDFVVLVTLPCMIFESFHMAFRPCCWARCSTTASPMRRRASSSTAPW